MRHLGIKTDDEIRAEKIEAAVSGGIMVRELRACCRPGWKEPHFVTKRRKGDVVTTETACTRCGKETVSAEVV